jgi:hypothetical protein
MTSCNVVAAADALTSTPVLDRNASAQLDAVIIALDEHPDAPLRIWLRLAKADLERHVPQFHGGTA